ncbi:MAG: glycoside hydrolase family 36 N-terminal domain-containing protein [Galbitalea sp.]
MTADPIHLRRGGTSVVIDRSRGGIPAIAYWGPDLGPMGQRELDSLVISGTTQQVPVLPEPLASLTLLPLESQAWQYEPALLGAGVDGRNATPSFSLAEIRSYDDGLVVVSSDEASGLDIELELRLGVTGLLSQRATIVNKGNVDFMVDSLQLSFPLPATAVELMDATGRHLKERSPQTARLFVGTYARESRKGRPGSDASLLLLAGTAGFGSEPGSCTGCTSPGAAIIGCSRFGRRTPRPILPAASCCSLAKDFSNPGSLHNTLGHRELGNRAGRALRSVP